MKIDSANLRDDDEAYARKLAAYWGALGLVQDRLGKLDEAEKNLNAAWRMTQDGVAAAHLCDLYDRQHKTQAAIQMCRFARNRLQMMEDPSISVVVALIAQNDAHLKRLSLYPSKSPSTDTIDEVIRMRDFKLPRVIPGTATAEFYVLLESDAVSGRFKVTGVKYLSGSEKLKSSGNMLNRLNLISPLPTATLPAWSDAGLFFAANTVDVSFFSSMQMLDGPCRSGRTKSKHGESHRFLRVLQF